MTAVPTPPKREAPAIDPQIEALLRRYLSEHGAARNLSAYTLRNYQSDLEGFFLALADRDVRPLSASRTVLRKYLGVLLGAGIVEASVKRKVSTIRGFYRWLRSEELLDIDPFFGVTGPKAPRRLPDILTSEDIDRLIAAAAGDTPASM